MNQPFPMHHFHPPGCGCSRCCPPCPPPPACCPPPGCVDQMQACWDSSQALYDLVKKVLQDVITSEPGILTATGVTDGSDVQPGQVGEYFQTLTNFNIPAQFNFQQIVAVGTLPAGDWDVDARVRCGSLVGGVQAWLNPVPAGFSHDMETMLAVLVSSTQSALQDCIITAPPVRANLTVDTLVSFQVNTNYFESPVLAPEAGTGTILFTARRMR